MQAEPGCGAGRAIVLPIWKNLVPKCGTLRELKSWGLQLVPRNSSTRSALPDWRKRTNCGRPSSGSLICNALGRSLSNAQVPDAITEDHAATSFRGVCGRARCRDAASHGIVVGRVARRRPSARSGHADCLVILKDVRFYPIFNFGHFWAALLKISGFYATRFFRQFWADPILFEALFWPKRRPKILNF